MNPRQQCHRVCSCLPSNDCSSIYDLGGLCLDEGAALMELCALGFRVATYGWHPWFLGGASIGGAFIGGRLV